MTVPPEFPRRSSVPGWLSVIVGGVGISVTVQNYFTTWAPGFADARGVAEDIAFSFLVLAAGVSLILDLRWARAWALAVWGALLAEVLCDGYWLGSWMILYWQSNVVYRQALPRLGYDLGCLLFGPLVTWKLFVDPTPEGLRRRVLVATFLGGFLLSGMGNLYLLSLRRF